jgi:Skp family chaperone for outer membrane proteins
MTASPRLGAPLLPLALVALLAVAALSPQRPSVVASVDLERVFNTIDLQSRTEARLNALAAEMGVRRDELRNRIEDLQGELDSFQPGSPAQLEVSRQIEQAVAEFRAWEGFMRLKFEAEQARALREIYLTIRTTAAALATERGWDFVMVDDTIPSIDPGDSARMLQQISSRRLLYANPAFDVTDLLIARLNSELAGSGG